MAGTPAGAAKRAATKAGAAAPTDRRAPARKAASKPTARKPTAAELGGMPAARVETLAEQQDVIDDLPDDGSVRVEFNGEFFDVRSPGDWRSSAQEAVAQGLFQTWSRGAMLPESAQRFATADLTNRECVEFMDAFDAAFRDRYGDDPVSLGKQFGSSRSTRRRSR